MTDDESSWNTDHSRRQGTARSATPHLVADGGPSRHLFRNFPDPLLYYETERETAVIRAVNPAFERQFDIDGAAITDARLVDHLLVDPADSGPGPNWVLADAADNATCTDNPGDPDMDLNAEEVLTRLTAGDPVTVGFQGDADSELQYFRLEAISAPDGATEGYIVYTRITDLRQQVHTLRARVDRLERVASITAHDLRNPLDVAKIRLEAARDTGEAVHFEKVEGALDRIQRLIQDMRSVGGGAVDPSEEVVLADIAAAAWDTVETADATLALDEDLPTITADTDALQQLFENLFRNAIEHGRRDVTVTVGRLPDGFYVADDGPGLAPTEYNRVFEPGYSTTDNNTGLGLAIVQQIVDDHGWQVVLSSSDAGGAHFAFRGIETDNLA